MPRSPMHPAPHARSPVDYTDRAYWNGLIKMSLSKFFILCVLHEKPMHGYEIARAVEQTTSGCCSPTQGTIYPVLREFEEGGYLTSVEEVVSGRARKVYSLTAKGREAFRVAVEAWTEATCCLSESGKIVRTAAAGREAGR